MLSAIRKNRRVTTVIRSPTILSYPPENRATIAQRTVDLKRIITTFTYRIEPKPEGGFIAHASDPSLPPLEAPTRLELQHKIQANISATLAAEFPGLKLPVENNQLKFDFHIEAKPGGGFLIHSHSNDPNHDPNTPPIEGATHEEIEHPFAEKLAGVLGKYFLPELSQALASQGNSGDIKVFVNRSLRVNVSTGSQKQTFGNTPTYGCQDARLSPAGAESEYLQPAGSFRPPDVKNGDVADAGDNSPIHPATDGNWTTFRLLALLVIAALMYFFLHR